MTPVYMFYMFFPGYIVHAFSRVHVMVHVPETAGDRCSSLCNNISSHPSPIIPFNIFLERLYIEYKMYEVHVHFLLDTLFVTFISPYLASSLRLKIRFKFFKAKLLLRVVKINCVPFLSVNADAQCEETLRKYAVHGIPFSQGHIVISRWRNNNKSFNLQY